MNYEIIYDEDINQYPLELNGYKIVYYNRFEIVDLKNIPKIKEKKSIID